MISCQVIVKERVQSACEVGTRIHSARNLDPSWRLWCEFHSLGLANYARKVEPNFSARSQLWLFFFPTKTFPKCWKKDDESSLRLTFHLTVLQDRTKWLFQASWGSGRGYVGVIDRQRWWNSTRSNRKRLHGYWGTEECWNQTGNAAPFNKTCLPSVTSWFST